MPLYDFQDDETGEIWEERMSYEDMKKLTSENPNIKLVYTTMNIVSGVGGIKNDSGFKDMLSRVADANPSSPLAEKHGSKDIKSVKVREAVNKYKNRK